MIAPGCGLAALKETLRRTCFEDEHYRAGGNLGSGKGEGGKLGSGRGVEVEVGEISVRGLGLVVRVHEENVEALLAMVGGRAPEMGVWVEFVKCG